MRTGLHGPDERLIDANTLSTDQNTSVSIASVSEDGGVMVYGIRAGWRRRARGPFSKPVHPQRFI
ncbi:MAG: hypothetical protein WA324_08605 [Bryobacteraceae bacterium]